ncbi:MAG: phage major tail tube protein [Arsenophonus sp. NC-WZS1-MAG3]
MTVMFSKNSLSSFKQHKEPEINSSFTYSYIKEVMDEQVMLDLDLIGNIFKINSKKICLPIITPIWVLNSNR